MSTDIWTRPRPHVAADDILDKQRRRHESETALIFALLIGACAAFGIVLLANSDRTNTPPAISDCTAIRVTAERLACFDKIGRASLTPFKGAVAPAELDGKNNKPE